MANWTNLLAVQIGAKLRKLREKRGFTLEDVASRANMSAGQISRLELGTRNLDIDDYIKLCDVLGTLPGDLLPRSDSAPAHMEAVEAIAEGLARLPERSRDALIHSFRVQIQAIAPIVATNVVRIPERTAPQWTREFPVDPSDFVERDTDFPLELHAVPVEIINAAAGGTGVISEIDVPQGWLLHDKEVRDTTHRVIAVRGDSMSPDYEEGWKLLLDMKKRTPTDGDPVMVYIQDEGDEGGLLGYWENTPKGPRLLKANPQHGPVELSRFNQWMVVGTIQKVVDAPAKKRGKK